MSVRPFEGRVALVTGANHGIGVSTALALAEFGADVVVTYLRLDVPDDDPGRPAAYAEHRRQDATAVVEVVRAAGSKALSIEADLADPASPARLFDQAEDTFGPVAILVNNASGWRQDTFTGASNDTLGRPNRAVTAESIDAQLLVDDTRQRIVDRRVRPPPPSARSGLGADHQPHLRRVGRVPRCSQKDSVHSVASDRPPRRTAMTHSLPASDVPEGTVTQAGKYAVGNNGGYFAVSRRCRHLRADLAGGSIDSDGCLVCPWHEAKYDVRRDGWFAAPKASSPRSRVSARASKR